MAAPTQEYPPWLTPSATVVTDAEGDVSTSTSIVYLPLTYFGPSVPLGTVYSYGGPAETASFATGFITTTATTSSAIPTVTTLPTTSSIPPTAIPTTSTPTTSSTSSTTATSSTTSITSIPTTSTQPPTSISTTSSEVPTITGPAPGPSTSALSRGQLVGVIVASVLGLIFLFVFLLALWLWCKGRRNRRPASTITPIDDDYFIVGEDGRTPGEGSPRHSGEEADPFLQPSQHQGMQEVATELGSRPGVPRVPPPVTGSLSSTGSSSTNASGYGVLLEQPTLGILPPMAEEGEYGRSPYQLSEDDMRRINRESVLPEEPEGEEYTGAYAIARDPLLPPPRLVDPDSHVGPHVDIPRPPIEPNPRSSGVSHPSLIDTEDAALLTARRIRVADSFLDESPSNTRSGFLETIGLANVAALARMTWFRSHGSPSSSPRNSRDRHSPTFQSVPLSDQDIETGRSLLSPTAAAMPDSFGRRGGIVGVGTDGQRPASNLSATSASGNTIWHDAHSSIPGTPALAAPPRALTPPELHYPEHAWISGRTPAVQSSPAYEDPFLSDSPVTQSPVIEGFPAGVDILDLPAPPSISQFASTSSARDSTISSAELMAKYPFPPGLEFGTRGKAWSQDGSMSNTSSPAWYQTTHAVTVNNPEPVAPVSIDILEEEPPNAGDNWRSISSAAGGGIGRRATFGMPQLMQPAAVVASEQGSLHSMRSHINPPSIRSTGSAPASHRDGSLSGSISSNSSRPSAHSARHANESASSSISQSLVRHGSVTSDGRRRFDSHAPPLSAFGDRGFQTPPRVTTPADIGLGLFKHGDIPTIDGSNPNPSGLAGISEIPSVHNSPDRASTIRTVNSGSTAVAGGRTRTVSAVTFGPGHSLQEEPLPLTGNWRPAAP